MRVDMVTIRGLQLQNEVAGEEVAASPDIAENQPPVPTHAKALVYRRCTKPTTRSTTIRFRDCPEGL